MNSTSRSDDDTTIIENQSSPSSFLQSTTQPIPRKKGPLHASIMAPSIDACGEKDALVESCNAPQNSVSTSQDKRAADPQSMIHREKQNDLYLDGVFYSSHPSPSYITASKGLINNPTKKDKPHTQLMESYSPYITPNDESIEAARERLKEAIDQTRLLRSAFTERVYNKYRILLRPVPSLSDILSPILQNPHRSKQTLQTETSKIKNEKENEKLVENEDEHYYGAGLNIVILPEQDVADDPILKFVEERGPLDPDTGVRLGGISTAAAAAAETVLERARRGILLRNDRLKIVEKPVEQPKLERFKPKTSQIASTASTNSLLLISPRAEVPGSASAAALISAGVGISQKKRHPFPKSKAGIAKKRDDLDLPTDSMDYMDVTEEYARDLEPVVGILKYFQEDEDNTSKIDKPRKRKVNEIGLLRGLRSAEQTKPEIQKQNILAYSVLFSLGLFNRDDNDTVLNLMKDETFEATNQSLSAEILKHCKPLAKKILLNIEQEEPEAKIVKLENEHRDEKKVMSPVKNKHKNSMDSQDLAHLATIEMMASSLPSTIQPPNPSDSRLNNFPIPLQQSPPAPSVPWSNPLLGRYPPLNQGQLYQSLGIDQTSFLPPSPYTLNGNTTTLNSQHPLLNIQNNNNRPILYGDIPNPEYYRQFQEWTNPLLNQSMMGRLNLTPTQARNMLLHLRAREQTAQAIQAAARNNLAKFGILQNNLTQNNGMSGTTPTRQGYNSPQLKAMTVPTLKTSPTRESLSQQPVIPTISNQSLPQSILSPIQPSEQTNMKDPPTKFNRKDPPATAKSKEPVFLCPPIPPGLNQEAATLILRGYIHKVTETQLAVSYLKAIGKAVPIPKTVFELKEHDNEVVLAAIKGWIWAEHQDWDTWLIQTVVDVATKALMGVDTKDEYEIASIVCKSLMKEISVNDDMDMASTNYQELTKLLETRREIALKHLSKERTLLANLLSRHVNISEFFSNAYVSSIIRAGEALGHEELSELVHDDECFSSSLMPYDVIVDESGAWEEPCQPEGGFTTKLTSDELTKRAHARARIHKSLYKLQEKFGIMGGVSSNAGPYADTGESSTFSSFPPPRGSIKRRTSSGSLQGDYTAPSSGMAQMFNPAHHALPLFWDLDDIHNKPYGIHGAQGKKGRRHKKARHNSPNDNGEEQPKTTAPIDWMHVARRFHIVTADTNTTTPKEKIDTGATQVIIAPIVHELKDDIHLKDDSESSDVEEDISDEAVLARHQEVLDAMKRKIELALEATPRRR